MDERQELASEAKTTGRQPPDEDAGRGHNRNVTRIFTQIEHYITIGIGVILVVTTLQLLSGTLAGVIDAWRHWPASDTVSTIVDELLFTLMLVEILHTVRQSIASDQITIEPFLIVGLIASVRRILIVTVEIANQSKGQDTIPFDHAMIELGVLGWLVLVLIASIYLSRRSRRAG
jgi:uncharacterized membrane protein (DUF373 family)